MSITASTTTQPPPRPGTRQRMLWHYVLDLLPALLAPFAGIAAALV